LIKASLGAFFWTRFFFNIENLVLRARSEFDGFAGKDCELFWSTGGIKIPNHKSQISNKSQ
jgi:hypothetical protein